MQIIHHELILNGYTKIICSDKSEVQIAKFRNNWGIQILNQEIERQGVARTFYCVTQGELLPDYVRATGKLVETMTINGECPSFDVYEVEK